MELGVEIERLLENTKASLAEDEKFLLKGSLEAAPK